VKPSPIAVAPSSLGGSATYSDAYKYLWGLALISPLTPLLGAYLEAKTGLGAFTWLSIVLWFGLVPIADWIIGPNGGKNPPETAVPLLERDPFYRYLTYCTVPIHYGAFLACVWYVGTQWNGYQRGPRTRAQKLGPGTFVGKRRAGACRLWSLLH
jgi:alkane 1-monooxygenase